MYYHVLARRVNKVHYIHINYDKALNPLYVNNAFWYLEYPNRMREKSPDFGIECNR